MLIFQKRTIGKPFLVLPGVTGIVLTWFTLSNIHLSFPWMAVFALCICLLSAAFAIFSTNNTAVDFHQKKVNDYYSFFGWDFFQQITQVETMHYILVREFTVNNASTFPNGEEKYELSLVCDQNHKIVLCTHYRREVISNYLEDLVQQSDLPLKDKTRNQDFEGYTKQ